MDKSACGSPPDGHATNTQQHKPVCKQASALKLLWQRCRNSLGDSTLSSCSKVDDIVLKSRRNKAALECLKLVQTIVQELVLRGVVGFASFCLVSQDRGVFGLAASSGQGAQFFPPLLEQGAEEALLHDTPFSLFSSSLFAVSASNWSVEDAMETGLPLYYDCDAAAAGLPQEAKWLQRAGLRRMLSLPCMHDGELQGVLTLGLACETVDQQLILKLQELAQHMTPMALDCKARLRHVLQPRSQPRRFESQNDIALAVVDEIVNLDQVVMGKLTSMRLLADSSCDVIQCTRCSSSPHSTDEKQGASGGAADNDDDSRQPEDVASPAGSGAAAAPPPPVAQTKGSPSGHDSASSLLLRLLSAASTQSSSRGVLLL